MLPIPGCDLSGETVYIDQTGLPGVTPLLNSCTHAQPVSGPQKLPLIPLTVCTGLVLKDVKLSSSPRCSPNRVSLSAGSGGAAAKCTFRKETQCGFFWLVSSVESIKCGRVRETSLNA